MNEQVRCSGITKKGEPCKRLVTPPEKFCNQHNPKTLNRKLRHRANIIVAQWFGILSLLIGLYCNYQSEERITDEFRKHSLAERTLASQYNPAKAQQVFEEFVNLLNNDPSIRKGFYIDGSSKVPQISIQLLGRDFRVHFIDTLREQLFDRFLLGGNRTFTLLKEDYESFYVIKNDLVIDSFSNTNIKFARDFPIFPPVKVSTIDPTGEYLCTSMLDVQIDSVIDNVLYLSNSAQNNTFRIRLTYDIERASFAFNQLSDISFDSNSSFYTVDQEISYCHFMMALARNAKVVIRHAITGDEIFVSSPFIPHNIDSGRSFESFQIRLSILNSLKWV